MKACPSHCGFKTNRVNGISDHFRSHPGCIPGRKTKAFKGYNATPKMKKADDANGKGKKSRR